MNHIYTSKLQPYIDGLIVEKRSSGFPYIDGAEILKRIDTFMNTNFPEQDTITKDAAYLWAQKQESECANSLLNRITLLRQLALFMNRQSVSAYVLEAKHLARHTQPAFFVFEPKELTRFFKAAETHTYARFNELLKLVVPSFFKTLYCLGLRPCEALRLEKKHCNLARGSIDIYQSKGDKDRTVYLADDLREALVSYDESVSKLLPDRKAFFPNEKGASFSTASARHWFCSIWSTLKIQRTHKAKIPSLMSFRHTFATVRIHLWANEGKDLSSVIYYLVKHMGHKSIHETEYYLHSIPQHYPKMLDKTAAISDAIIPEVN